MKLKLAALLFSQAAAEAVQIDKSNYKEHLCGAELFKPVKVVTEIQPRYMIDAELKHISAVHDLGYCVDRDKYEKAVIEKSKQTINPMTSCFNDGKGDVSISRTKCVEKTGMAYARWCEELKKNKQYNPQAWNEALPDFKNCAAPRR